MIRALAERRPSRRLLLCAYSVVAVADSLLAARDTHRSHSLRLVTKPALMSVLAAATADRERRVALAFGWGGDLLLLKDDDPRFFAAGAGSFGLGHMVQIARLRGEGARVSVPSRAVFAGMWLLIAPVLTRAAQRSQPGLGVPVAAYSAVLATMAAHAWSSTSRAARSGGLLFLASDFLLGVRAFVVQDPSAGTEAVVMLTYTAAQVLLSQA